MILISLFTWSNSVTSNLMTIEKIQYVVILLLVVFGILIGIGRILSLKKKEPLNDEMTIKILTKSSSISYYISLYLWVIILILKDRYKYDTEIWIGTGIISMSVVFVLSFIVVKFRGVSQ